MSGRNSCLINGVAGAFAFVASGMQSAAGAQDLGGSAFDCLIEPAMVVKLGTPVEGIIAEVLVDRGDTVGVGQVVARLESKVEAERPGGAHSAS